MTANESDLLWFLFQWLWLAWISLICPACIVFAIIALASNGNRKRRYRQLAAGFATVAAVGTFVFIGLLILI